MMMISDVFTTVMMIICICEFTAAAPGMTESVYEFRMKHETMESAASNIAPNLL